MGLKNKNSIFDLSNGPVSDMETQQGPQFQRTIDEATDKSIASLGEVPITSQFQDLNGVPGPQSQLPIPDASQRHVDSLTKQIQITNKGVGIFTEPYHIDPSTLDLNGGLGPQFDGSTPQTQQQTLHTDSLIKIYNSNINPLASYGAGQPGGTWPTVRPSPLGANFADLDGLTPTGYTNPDTGVSY